MSVCPVILLNPSTSVPIIGFAVSLVAHYFTESLQDHVLKHTAIEQRRCELPLRGTRSRLIFLSPAKRCFAASAPNRRAIYGMVPVADLSPASACRYACYGLISALDDRFQRGVFGQEQLGVLSENRKRFFAGFFQNRHIADDIYERQYL